MRLGNLDGRAVLISADTHAADIAALSGGRFGPDLPPLYEQWDEFREWAHHVRSDVARQNMFEIDRTLLGPPSPAPRQILAVGLNYSEHALETGMESTGLPPVFTKFASSLAGPDTDVVLPAGGRTDWEVELVVVVGKRASRIDESAAWSTVAGVTVGQDLSERFSQLAGAVPQFSLGKSFAGFAPTGPWLVTTDKLTDADDLELGCELNGTVVQKARTSQMTVSIPRLLAALSQTVTLLPGDLVFTGTPAGVGMGRTPQEFLKPGDRLRTWIEGVGELHQQFV